MHATRCVSKASKQGQHDMQATRCACKASEQGQHNMQATRCASKASEQGQHNMQATRCACKALEQGQHNMQATSLLKFLCKSSDQLVVKCLHPGVLLKLFVQSKEDGLESWALQAATRSAMQCLFNLYQALHA
eukprot:1153600-Pelagomonas_calceolata.AAC.6